MGLTLTRTLTLTLTLAPTPTLPLTLLLTRWDLAWGDEAWHALHGALPA